MVMRASGGGEADHQRKRDSEGLALHARGTGAQYMRAGSPAGAYSGESRFQHGCFPGAASSFEIQRCRLIVYD